MAFESCTQLSILLQGKLSPPRQVNVCLPMYASAVEIHFFVSARGVFIGKHVAILPDADS
jgi:hypothetical protein